MPLKLLKVKAAIVASGRQYRDVAAAVHVTPGVLSLVLNGHASSWPALRRRLAAELGLPEEELFADETVAP